MESPITLDYCRNLIDFTENYLCDVADNVYNIKFLKFRVRDMDSSFVLFEVCDDEDKSMESNTSESNNKDDLENPNNSRSIRYHLGPEFLELRNIGTELTFSIGQLPVKNLVMLERHYFKGKLIKSFEFKFDFCIPNSVNTWETLYIIPELDADLKEEMIDSPWETKSDSFYFVNEKIIMHHKALYNYSILE